MSSGHSRRVGHIRKRFAIVTINIRVLRYINAFHGAPCYLLGFCDASVDKSVFLIETKTKLAPLKSLTIPRLELNDFLLLVRWLKCIREMLDIQLHILSVLARVGVDFAGLLQMRELQLRKLRIFKFMSLSLYVS